MGLLDGTTQRTYYGSGNSANYGDYQFVSLDHIINGFMVAYVGESKLISKVNRTDVQFHGMRAIQEFSYDIFRSVKTQEIEVPNTLKMILPQDYVNYSKVTRVDSDGIERILYPTGKTSNPLAINQNADGTYTFDHNSDGDTDDTNEDSLAYATDSDTWTKYKAGDTSSDSTDDYDGEDHTFGAFGRRYGLDPQHAQANGTFYIDTDKGFVHFSSSLTGKTIVLHYISDGLGTDGEMVVHKFAEEAVYKWIAYGIISSRTNIPEYIVQRFKKERFAEARKAKIRLSNIKIEEFTQVLKGLGKSLK
jgi:hypothetical protein